MFFFAACSTLLAYLVRLPVSSAVNQNHNYVAHMSLVQIPDKQLDMKSTERQPPTPEPISTTSSTVVNSHFESDVDSDNEDESPEERSRPRGNIPIRRRLSTFEDAVAVLSDVQTLHTPRPRDTTQNQNHTTRRSPPS